MNTCRLCNNTIYYDNKSGLCRACWLEERKNKYITNWLENGLVVIRLREGWIRDYILNEQGGKCVICGIDNTWNSNHLVFILDHIDGDNTNHKHENIRLICPNCDSQLPTYKAKNKGRGSKYNRDNGNLRYHQIKEKIAGVSASG